MHTLRLALTAALAATALPVAADEVNIYSSRHYDTDEALYSGFTEATGITVNRIEGSPEELIARMQAEGANSPADIFLTVDAGRIWLADKDVDTLVNRLLGWSFEERVANPCIGSDRADLVLAGCAILQAIRRAWPAKVLRVADRGLREGLLTEMMVADGVWRRPSYAGTGQTGSSA